MNLQQMAQFEIALLQRPIDPVIGEQVKKQIKEMRMRRGNNQVPLGKMKFRCPRCGQIHYAKESKIIKLNGQLRRVCKYCR